MKALLLSKYRHLEIADLPNPTPGPAEILVKVAACGICGSDVHGYDGSSGRRIPPIVMGHEAAGRVAKIGAGVAGVFWGGGGGGVFTGFFGGGGGGARGGGETSGYNREFGGVFGGSLVAGA